VSKGIGGHHKRILQPRYHATQDSETWLTPPWILDALGPFDLDPCTPVKMPWKTAAKRYTPEDDGLSQPWEGRVWCNPPYGRAAVSWLKKMSDHNNGILMIFARCETEMFHKYVWPMAEAILFMRGRVSFFAPDGSVRGNSGGPSCLIAYGESNLDSLWNCGIPGTVILLAHSVHHPGRCTKHNPIRKTTGKTEQQIYLGE
jgi:hypothetical protein